MSQRGEKKKEKWAMPREGESSVEVEWCAGPEQTKQSQEAAGELGVCQ